MNCANIVTIAGDQFRVSGFMGFTRGHALPNNTLLKVLVNLIEVVILHVSTHASSDVPGDT